MDPRPPAFPPAADGIRRPIPASAPSSQQRKDLASTGADGHQTALRSTINPATTTTAATGEMTFGSSRHALSLLMKESAAFSAQKLQQNILQRPQPLGPVIHGRNGSAETAKNTTSRATASGSPLLSTSSSGSPMLSTAAAAPPSSSPAPSSARVTSTLLRHLKTITDPEALAKYEAELRVMIAGNETRQRSQIYHKKLVTLCQHEERCALELASDMGRKAIVKEEAATRLGGFVTLSSSSSPSSSTQQSKQETVRLSIPQQRLICEETTARIAIMLKGLRDEAIFTEYSELMASQFLFDFEDRERGSVCPFLSLTPPKKKAPLLANANITRCEHNEGDKGIIGSGESTCMDIGGGVLRWLKRFEALERDEIAKRLAFFRLGMEQYETDCQRAAAWLAATKRTSEFQDAERRLFESKEMEARAAIEEKERTFFAVYVAEAYQQRRWVLSTDVPQWEITHRARLELDEEQCFGQIMVKHRKGCTTAFVAAQQGTFMRREETMRQSLVNEERNTFQAILTRAERRWFELYELRLLEDESGVINAAPLRFLQHDEACKRKDILHLYNSLSEEMQCVFDDRRRFIKYRDAAREDFFAECVDGRMVLQRMEVEQRKVLNKECLINSYYVRSQDARRNMLIDETNRRAMLVNAAQDELYSLVSLKALLNVQNEEFLARLAIVNRSLSSFARIIGKAVDSPAVLFASLFSDESSERESLLTSEDSQHQMLMAHVKSIVSGGAVNLELKLLREAETKARMNICVSERQTFIKDVAMVKLFEYEALCRRAREQQEDTVRKIEFERIVRDEEATNRNERIVPQWRSELFKLTANHAIVQAESIIRREKIESHEQEERRYLHILYLRMSPLFKFEAAAWQIQEEECDRRMAIESHAELVVSSLFSQTIMKDLFPRTLGSMGYLRRLAETRPVQYVTVRTVGGDLVLSGGDEEGENGGKPASVTAPLAYPKRTPRDSAFFYSDEDEDEFMYGPDYIYTSDKEKALIYATNNGQEPPPPLPASAATSSVQSPSSIHNQSLMRITGAAVAAHPRKPVCMTWGAFMLEQLLSQNRRESSRRRRITHQEIRERNVIAIQIHESAQRIALVKLQKELWDMSQSAWRRVTRRHVAREEDVFAHIFQSAEEDSRTQLWIQERQAMLKVLSTRTEAEIREDSAKQVELRLRVLIWQGPLLNAMYEDRRQIAQEEFDSYQQIVLAKRRMLYYKVYLKQAGAMQKQLTPQVPRDAYENDNGALAGLLLGGDNGENNVTDSGTFDFVNGDVTQLSPTRKFYGVRTTPLQPLHNKQLATASARAERHGAALETAAQLIEHNLNIRDIIERAENEEFRQICSECALGLSWESHRDVEKIHLARTRMELLLLIAKGYDDDMYHINDDDENNYDANGDAASSHASRSKSVAKHHHQPTPTTPQPLVSDQFRELIDDYFRKRDDISEEEASYFANIAGDCRKERKRILVRRDDIDFVASKNGEGESDADIAAKDEHVDENVPLTTEDTAAWLFLRCGDVIADRSLLSKMAITCRAIAMMEKEEKEGASHQQNEEDDRADEDDDEEFDVQFALKLKMYSQDLPSVYPQAVKPTLMYLCPNEAVERALARQEKANGTVLNSQTSSSSSASAIALCPEYVANVLAALKALQHSYSLEKRRARDVERLKIIQKRFDDFVAVSVAREEKGVLPTTRRLSRQQQEYRDEYLRAVRRAEGDEAVEDDDDENDNDMSDEEKEIDYTKFKNNHPSSVKTLAKLRKKSRQESISMIGSPIAAAAASSSASSNSKLNPASEFIDKGGPIATAAASSSASSNSKLNPAGEFIDKGGKKIDVERLVKHSEALAAEANVNFKNFDTTAPKKALIDMSLQPRLRDSNSFRLLDPTLLAALYKRHVASMIVSNSYSSSSSSSVEQQQQHAQFARFLRFTDQCWCAPVVKKMDTRRSARPTNKNSNNKYHLAVEATLVAVLKLKKMRKGVDNNNSSTQKKDGGDGGAATDPLEHNKPFTTDLVVSGDGDDEHDSDDRYDEQVYAVKEVMKGATIMMVDGKDGRPEAFTSAADMLSPERLAELEESGLDTSLITGFTEKQQKEQGQQQQPPVLRAARQQSAAVKALTQFAATHPTAMTQPNPIRITMRIVPALAEMMSIIGGEGGFDHVLDTNDDGGGGGGNNKQQQTPRGSSSSVTDATATPHNYANASANVLIFADNFISREPNLAICGGGANNNNTSSESSVPFVTSSTITIHDLPSRQAKRGILQSLTTSAATTMVIASSASDVGAAGGGDSNNATTITDNDNNVATNQQSTTNNRKQLLLLEDALLATLAVSSSSSSSNNNKNGNSGSVFSSAKAKMTREMLRRILFSGAETPSRAVGGGGGGGRNNISSKHRHSSITFNENGLIEDSPATMRNDDETENNRNIINPPPNSSSSSSDDEDDTPFDTTAEDCLDVNHSGGGDGSGGALFCRVVGATTGADIVPREIKANSGKIGNHHDYHQKRSVGAGSRFNQIRSIDDFDVLFLRVHHQNYRSDDGSTTMKRDGEGRDVNENEEAEDKKALQEGVAPPPTMPPPPPSIIPLRLPDALACEQSEALENMLTEALLYTSNNGTTATTTTATAIGSGGQHQQLPRSIKAITERKWTIASRHEKKSDDADNDDKKKTVPPLHPPPKWWCETLREPLDVLLSSSSRAKGENNDKHEGEEKTTTDNDANGQQGSHGKQQLRTDGGPTVIFELIAARSYKHLNNLLLLQQQEHQQQQDPSLLSLLVDSAPNNDDDTTAKEGGGARTAEAPTNVTATEEERKINPQQQKAGEETTKKNRNRNNSSSGVGSMRILPRLRDVTVLGVAEVSLNELALNAAIAAAERAHTADMQLKKRSSSKLEAVMNKDGSIGVTGNSVGGGDFGVSPFLLERLGVGGKKNNELSPSAPSTSTTTITTREALLQTYQPKAFVAHVPLWYEEEKDGDDEGATTLLGGVRRIGNVELLFSTL